MIQPVLIEPHSGISFPASLTPAGSRRAHWITGTGIQKYSIFRIKIYAFGLYVDRVGARAALATYAGRLAASLAADADFCRRLLELEFAMSLRLVLIREVAGTDVGRAFDEALQPRMERQHGGADAAANRRALLRFRNYFPSDRLRQGTEMMFSCNPAGRLVTVVAANEPRSIDSLALCRVLFDLYLGMKPISKQGKRSAIEGFPALLAKA